MDAKTPPPVPLDAVLADSVADFCRRASISHSSFFEAVKRGEIRTVKRGRRTLVPRSEIFRFLGEIEQQEPGR